jgi:HEAT repeat protein
MNFLNQLFDSSVRFQRKYAEYLFNRFQTIACPGTRIDLPKQWVTPRGLAVALGEPRLVITGSAGMGKTTTLAHLALTLAQEMLRNEKSHIPLFFSARDLHPQGLPRITDVARELELRADLLAQCPPTFFPQAFTSNRVVVLIDDADALPADTLKAWLHELKDVRVILAAQHSIDGLAEFRLPGFRDHDLDCWATNWDAATATAFLAALKSSGVPRALTANPLTLTMLRQVWCEGENLPINRTDLFDAIAHRVLEHSEEANAMLEGVALAIQRGKPASNEFVSKARGFLRLAKNRSAEFIHELWQAYFAARALRRAPTLEPLAEHLNDPAWREVVLFYAGLGDATALVQRLTAHDEIVFAGWVIAHARQIQTDLRDSITKELVARGWDGDPNALAALSNMHSEVAVDTFAAKLKEKDPALRRRAAQLLGQLQLDRGIEYLLPQLRDVSADVRDCVIEALGRSRTDRVIEPLLVALRGDPRVGTADTRLRVAAAKALGEVASDKAAPALIVDLQMGEPEVRAAAAEALKRIASPLLVKPLQSVSRTGDESARRYAADILSVIDGKD